MESLYDILGIDKGATKQEIKTAFKKLAQKHHPDKNNGGNNTFDKIKKAYEILYDDVRRELYDTKGITGSTTSLELQARDYLRTRFIGLIKDAHIDLVAIDIFELMMKHILQEKNDVNNNLSKVKRKKEQLNIVVKNLSCDNDDGDLFRIPVVTYLKELEDHLDAGEKHLEMLGVASQVLKHHQYNVQHRLTTSDGIETTTIYISSSFNW